MDGFVCERLDANHVLQRGALPAVLLPDEMALAVLWQLHPAAYHRIKILGKLVPTPRWQQAFGRDYRYSKTTNAALPVPPDLQPFLEWARLAVDARLNGLLLNWYDGALGHYIGKHRDSVTGLVPGTPIVTISLGDTRTFRLRPWKGEGVRDVSVSHGTVLVMPWETNRAWTHEVPRTKHSVGRRISITLRAFAE